MIDDERVRYSGRLVQKRAPDLVADAWLFSESPRLLVRTCRDPKMTEVGRVAAVLNSIAPSGLSWMVLRHGAFQRSQDVPVVTDETTWHATKKGLLPHDIRSMPIYRLRDIKDEMSLIPIESDHG